MATAEVQGKQICRSGSGLSCQPLMKWIEPMTRSRHPMKVTKAQILATCSQEQAKASIAAMRAVQRPPSPQEWAAMYGTLLLHFPVQNLTERQEKLKFQTFMEDLAGIPAPCIAAALQRYRREPSPDGKQKFFPQAWQILAMCEEERAEAKRILAACEEMDRVLEGPDEPVEQVAFVPDPVDFGARPRPAARVIKAFSRRSTDPEELKAAIERRMNG